MIVGVKILQFFLVNRDFQEAILPFAPEYTLIGAGRYGFRQSRPGMKLDNQFPPAQAVYVFIIVCLDLYGFYRLVEQVIIGQHGQGLQHSLQIFRIVEEDGLFRVLGRTFNVFPVDADQFTP